LYKGKAVKSAANVSAAMTLRDDVADMYQGFHVLRGDPYIQAYDYCFAIDSNTSLVGGYQVKEVVNHFSVDAGYLTSVSPDCIVTLTSSRTLSFLASAFQLCKMYSAYHVYRLATLAAIFSMAKGSTAVKLATLAGFEVAANAWMSVADAEYLKGLKLERRDLIGSLPELKQTNPQAHSAAKARLSEINKELKQIRSIASPQKLRSLMQSSKALGKSRGLGAVRNMHKLARAGAPIGSRGAIRVARILTAASVLGLLIKVATFVITGVVGNMIGRWLSNRQCLIIMPLSINGAELTAGINGHSGAVVGDPAGPMDHVLGMIFNSEYASKQIGGWGYIAPFIIDFILPGASDTFNPTPYAGEFDTAGFNDYIARLRQDVVSTSKTNVTYTSPNNISGQVRVPHTSSALQTRILQNAYSYLGRSLGYVWGRQDCSWFVSQVLIDSGVINRRMTSQQFLSDKRFARVPENNLEAGDLIIYSGKKIGHVAIYVGDGKIIDMSSSTSRATGGRDGISVHKFNKSKGYNYTYLRIIPGGM